MKRKKPGEQDDWIRTAAGGAVELTDAEPLEFTRAFWDAELDASMWFGLENISPKEAALLLCGLNPNDPRADGTTLAEDGRPNADAYRVMLRWFDDEATDKAPRTLRDWLAISSDKGLRHHPWVDKWLAASPGDSRQVRSDGYDHRELADPRQLIAAFGPHTGMDGSWFKNLKDAPALRAARKQRGRGGRASRAVEPLFCPYEVMKWLIDPGRKKGRQLREEAGWRLLKGHFPASYRRFRASEPPPDDT